MTLHKNLFGFNQRQVIPRDRKESFNSNDVEARKKRDAARSNYLEESRK